MPLTWGRISAVCTAKVRPGNSVLIASDWVAMVITPTSVAARAGAALLASPQPLSSAARAIRLSELNRVNRGRGRLCMGCFLGDASCSRANVQEY